MRPRTIWGTKLHTDHLESLESFGDLRMDVGCAVNLGFQIVISTPQGV
ncbi:MAG: hypothetical protein AAGC85_07200 [Bacteroidota bacterium]